MLRAVAFKTITDSLVQLNTQVYAAYYPGCLKYSTLALCESNKSFYALRNKSARSTLSNVIFVCACFHGSMRILFVHV